MQITGINKSKCEIRLQAKIYRSRNKRPDRRAAKILELVHIDLVGPIDPIEKAKGDFRYVLGRIDDVTCLIMSYMLKNKKRRVESF